VGPLLGPLTIKKEESGNLKAKVEHTGEGKRRTVSSDDEGRERGSGGTL